MKIGAQIVVKGIVQGVGFRWFVQREAQKLGLTGYVKNMPHGHVFVKVEGDKGMVQELVKVLRIGNPASHVVAVEVQEFEFKNEHNSFDILF